MAQLKLVPIFLLAIALASVVITSCGGTSEDENSEGSLVIYSGRSESLVKPIIDQFAEATGIDVSVKYGSTAEIAATLLEEGENARADVFFAQDPGGLGSVAAMLGQIPDEVLNLAPDWARSPEGKWVGASGRARVITYNTSRLAEADLPDTLWGFTDPQWKGPHRLAAHKRLVSDYGHRHAFDLGRRPNARVAAWNPRQRAGGLSQEHTRCGSDRVRRGSTWRS